MRLSGLVVALLLFVSPAMFAQHSSGGGSSSGGSHGGSSGGSSSASSSSNAHSSGNSASSSSHGSGASSSRSSSGRLGGRHETGNSGRTQGHSAVEPIRNQPAYRRFFNSLCRPFRKHSTTPVEVDLQPRTCPSGQSLDKNGRCVKKSTAASSGLTGDRLN
jgi:hypothetical protein